MSEANAEDGPRSQERTKYDRMDENNISNLSFVFCSQSQIPQNKRKRNPARIPSQTLPAGEKSAEAGRSETPENNVSSCRVLFLKFPSQDFVGNRFGFYSNKTALSRKVKNNYE